MKGNDLKLLPWVPWGPRHLGIQPKYRYSGILPLKRGPVPIWQGSVSHCHHPPS